MSRLPRLPSRVLLFSLLSLTLPLLLCRVHAASRHDAPSEPPAIPGVVPLAVAFHFGPSYATCAGRFYNGTVTNLAKVPGSHDYTALMQRMVREPSPDQPPGLLQGLWGLLVRILRLPPSKDVSLLVDMASTLKADSEAALGWAIGSAAVTAPWMAAWDGQVAGSSTIDHVLRLVGVEPVSDEASHPPYLGEANALLAANKGRLCLGRYCGIDDGPGGQGSIAFLISYTNESLHTSFQVASCFYYNAWDNHLSTIDPEYGHDMLRGSGQPKVFQGSLRNRLLGRVTEHAKTHPEHSQLDFVVLVAGEAADAPEFKQVLKEVVQGIPNARTGGATTVAEEDKRSQPGVELVVAEDPTFAAAHGAAYWMWMRLDGSYCDEWCAANPVECLSQYDMVKDNAGHSEL